MRSQPRGIALARALALALAAAPASAQTVGGVPFVTGLTLDGGAVDPSAGTDADFSVTQSGAGDQFDVWLRFLDPDPYASSSQCPKGDRAGCFLTSDGTTPATLTADHVLLPGVLRAHTANVAGDVAGDVAPFVAPEPPRVSLLAVGATLLGAAVGRRRFGGD